MVAFVAGRCTAPKLPIPVATKDMTVKAKETAAATATLTITDVVAGPETTRTLRKIYAPDGKLTATEEKETRKDPVTTRTAADTRTITRTIEVEKRVLGTVPVEVFPRWHGAILGGTGPALNPHVGTHVQYCKKRVCGGVYGTIEPQNTKAWTVGASLGVRL